MKTKKRIHFFNHALLVLWVLGFLLISNPLKADHINGSDITYRGLDSFRYEITYKIYRDCSGVALSYPTGAFAIKCVTSGASLSLKPTLKSIRDLTPVCDSVPKPCYPSNTKGTGNGTEEHVYIDTINFKDTLFKSTFSGCCQFNITFSICCRQSGITTGSANTNYYNYAMLDICKAPGNSSPTWTSDSYHSYCTNQSIFYNPGASDTFDFDSLSYALSYPMCSPTCVTSYAGGWPLTVYYPGSLKYPYINVNANPPIGLYLDPRTGDFICMPTKSGETSPVVFEVKEWRKDSTGKYVLIGITRQDVLFTISNCPGNNPPIIDGPYSYNVCANSTLCFNLTTDDKVKVPPPPAPKPAADTVEISWNKGIPDASFTITNKGALHQTGRFCWTPTDEDARTLPYQFVVSASDNTCPINAISYRAFYVRVKPNAKANIVKTNLGCSKVEVVAVTDTSLTKPTSYQWQILNSKGQSIADKRLAPYFKSGTFISSKSSDTIQFQTNGTYVLKLIVNNNSNCPKTYIDTLVIDSVFESRIASPSDTTICDGQQLGLDISTTFGQPTFQHQWNTGDTSKHIDFQLHDTLNIFDLMLKSVDSKGCIAFDKITVMKRQNPKVELIKDYTICENDTVHLNPKTTLAIWDDPRTIDTSYVAQGSYLMYQWTYANDSFSSDSAIDVTQAGKYSVKITDSTGCSSSEGFELIINDIDLIPMSDTAQCYGSTINLIPINYDSLIKGKNGFYRWWDITDIQNKKYFGQDLTSAKLTKNQTLMIHIGIVLNTVYCVKYDTVNFISNPLPTIDIPNDTHMCCNTTSFDLHNLLNKGIWSSSDTTKLKNGRYFEPNVSCNDAGKQFFLKYELIDSTTQCFSVDSFKISTRKLPPSQHNDKAFCGSLKTLNPISQNISPNIGNWSSYEFDWSCLDCDSLTWLKLYSHSGHPPIFNIGSTTFNLSDNQSETVTLRLFLRDKYGCENQDTAKLTILGPPKINRKLFSGNGPYLVCDVTNVVLQTNNYPSVWWLFREGKIENNLLRTDTITLGTDVLFLNAGIGCTKDFIFLDFQTFQKLSLLGNDTSFVSVKNQSIKLTLKANAYNGISWFTAKGGSLDKAKGSDNTLFFDHNKSTKVIDIPVWIVVDSAEFCTSNSDTIQFSVRPDPCTSFEVTGNKNKITCTPDDQNQNNYHWQLDNGLSSNDIIPDFNLTSSDTAFNIHLTTTSAFNDSCSTIQQFTYKSLGIQPVNLVQIVPNPVSDFIYLKNLQQIKMNYRIWNMNGQLIMQGKIEDGKINCALLVNGTYHLELNNDDSVFHSKFVVQK